MRVGSWPNTIHSRRPRLTLRVLLMVMFVMALAPSGMGRAQALPPDEPVPGGHFYRQTGGGNGLGFAVTDADGMPFWSTFQQLGGTAALGYPISRRFVREGFTYQATQVGVLQYRPDSGTVVLANIFEWLEQAGRDPWLQATKGIPFPMGDGAASFEEAVAIRMSWLTDESIKQRYLAPPSAALAAGWGQNQAMQLYGLPASRPEKAGPYIAQRFQRIAFQHWVATAPGLPAIGTITPVLGGDLLKEAEVLTGLAIVPHAIEEPAPVVEPSTAPATSAPPAPPVPTSAQPSETTNIKVTHGPATSGTLEGYTLRISWESVQGAEYYKVYHDDIHGGEKCRVSSDGRPVFCEEIASRVVGTDYLHTVDGFREDNYYWVVACNSSGCSGLPEAAIPFVVPKFKPTLIGSCRVGMELNPGEGCQVSASLVNPPGPGLFSLARHHRDCIPGKGCQVGAGKTTFFVNPLGRGCISVAGRSAVACGIDWSPVVSATKRDDDIWIIADVAAVTGSISKCSGRGDPTRFVTVTISGTIRAHRVVSSVSVEGKVGNEPFPDLGSHGSSDYAIHAGVGPGRIGPMKAGDVRNFTIRDSLLSPRGDSCSIRVIWEE